MAVVVDVAILEEVDGALLRSTVLVVALPAEEEQDNERDCDQANHAADHTPNNRASV